MDCHQTAAGHMDSTLFRSDAPFASEMLTHTDQEALIRNTYLTPYHGRIYTHLSLLYLFSIKSLSPALRSTSPPPAPCTTVGWDFAPQVSKERAAGDPARLSANH
jgi:hypothetical protein